MWDRVFGSKGRGLGINKPKETRLAVTEPIFNLPNVQEHYDQMLFEEYEFDAVLRCPGALCGCTSVDSDSLVYDVIQRPALYRPPT